MNKISVLLTIILLFLHFSFIVVLVLCHNNVITIPYITPLSHFLAYIIAPIVPFIAPLVLGILLKIYRCQALRGLEGRRNLLLMAGSQVVAHMQRVVTDSLKLYSSRSGWCEVGKCTSEYVQAALIVAIVIAELVGVKWDAGYIDRFLVRYAEEEMKKVKDSSMEKGEVFTDEDDVRHTAEAKA